MSKKTFNLNIILKWNKYHFHGFENNGGWYLQLVFKFTLPKESYQISAEIKVNHVYV